MLWNNLPSISSTENFLKVDRLALLAQIVHFQRRGRDHVSTISGETLQRGLGVSSTIAIKFEVDACLDQALLVLGTFESRVLGKW